MDGEEPSERGRSATPEPTSRRKLPLLGIRLHQTPHPIFRKPSSKFLPSDIVLFKDTEKALGPVRQRRNKRFAATRARIRKLLSFPARFYPFLFPLIDILALVVLIPSLCLGLMISHTLSRGTTHVRREDLLEITVGCLFIAVIWLLLLLPTDSAALTSGRRLLEFIRFYKHKPGPGDIGDNGDSGEQMSEQMSREEKLKFLDQGYFLLLLSRYPDYFTSFPPFLRNGLNQVYLGYYAYSRWAMATSLIPFLQKGGGLEHNPCDESSHIVALHEHEYFGPGEDTTDPSVYYDASASIDSDTDVSADDEEEVVEEEYLVMWIPRRDTHWSRLEAWLSNFL
ncbi:hypothetical protein F5Y07DRAFT_402014 [Xylaria sp. FL0933]|nr:hypothetical protein F5Y07DRAFT_402014 [Xylaria sp. FL0933]